MNKCTDREKIQYPEREVQKCYYYIKITTFVVAVRNSIDEWGVRIDKWLLYTDRKAAALTLSHYYSLNE